MRRPLLIWKEPFMSGSVYMAIRSQWRVGQVAEYYQPLMRPFQPTVVRGLSCVVRFHVSVPGTRF